MTSQRATPASVRLREIVAEVFGLPLESVGPTTSAETVEEWDSFGHMRLVMAVEEAFGISLSMEQVRTIDSFATLTGVIPEDADDVTA
jgi:acyl carrier protein